MEHLPALLSAVIAWRVVFSAALSLAIGAALASLFPAAAAPCVVLPFAIGTTAGVWWQVSSTAAHTNAAPQPVVSRPVAFLGMAFVGFICFGFVFVVVQSVPIAVLAAGLLPFLLAPVVGKIVKRSFAVSQILFSSSAFLAGSLAPLALRALLDAGF